MNPGLYQLQLFTIQIWRRNRVYTRDTDLEIQFESKHLSEGIYFALPKKC
jgi:hypothetical protein